MKINNHFVYIRNNFKPKINWAVFLDRDGVINKEKHLIHKIKDFELINQVSKAIKKLNQLNIPVIVFHQANVVSRGLCSEKQVQKLNKYMIKLLKKDNAYVDAIFYCPHHPDAFNRKYLKNCSWRKPKPGMLKAAAKQFNLNLKKSYVVGDMDRDLLTGQKVNATTILVKTGHPGHDNYYQTQPDKTCKNLLFATKFILKKENLK